MSENKGYLHIGIEKSVHPEFSSFHLNRRMSTKSLGMFNIPIDIHDGRLNDTGPIGIGILRDLDLINGLTHAWVEPYKLTIKKARMFDWEELTPQIVAVLKDVLHDPDAEVQTLPEMIDQVINRIVRHFAYHPDEETEELSDEVKEADALTPSEDETKTE